MPTVPQPMPEHFTAWITTDPTCLEGDNADVVVLRDENTGDQLDRDGAETPVWSSTGDPLTHVVTSINVTTDDPWDGRLTAEAEDLLARAGWTVTGGWKSVSTGVTATVTPA